MKAKMTFICEKSGKVFETEGQATASEQFYPIVPGWIESAKARNMERTLYLAKMLDKLFNEFCKANECTIQPFKFVAGEGGVVANVQSWFGGKCPDVEAVLWENLHELVGAVNLGGNDAQFLIPSSYAEAVYNELNEYFNKIGKYAPQAPGQPETPVAPPVQKHNLQQSAFNPEPPQSNPNSLGWASGGPNS